MKSLTLVILLVLPTLPLSQGISFCVRGLKTLTDDRVPPHDRSLLTGQIVIPAYTFTCSGVVTGWEAVVTGGTLSSVHFQVWQWVSAFNMHRLVGENVIPSSGSTDGLRKIGKRLQLSVTSPREQIHVSPGDFIGIFIGSERDTKLQSKMSPDTIAYISPGPLKGFAKPLDHAFSENRMIAPQINVTVRGEEFT